MAAPSRAALVALGHAARAARRAGLASALRLVRDGADRLLLRLGRPPLRARVDGLDLRGYLRHRSFLAHVSRGDYEPYERNLFERCLRPGTTVVDAGAHVGLYTLLASRLVGPEGRVVAFEPDPYNAAALERNVARAGCTNVSVRRAALSDAPGRASFTQSMATIGSSLVPRADVGPSVDLEVEVTSLDAELAAEGGPLVVKLDVEGAEPRALDGMSATLRGRPEVALFAEINPSALAAAGASAADVLAELRGAGLDVLAIDDERRRLVPVAADPVLGKGNLLCLRGMARPG